MKSNFKTYELGRFITAVSSKLGGNKEEGCQETRLGFADDNGLLSVFDFEDGVQALFFDGKLEEAYDWHFAPVKPSPMLLFFLVRGRVGLSYGDIGTDNLLKPLQSIFLAYPERGLGSTLRIGVEENATFLMLVIEREVYMGHIGCFPKEIAAELSSVFSEQPTAKQLVPGHEQGAQTAVLLQEILSFDQPDGFARATAIEAKVLEVLGLQLRCWEESIGGGAAVRPLSQADAEKMNEAMQLLVQDLQAAPTIEELARLSGINRQKLKLNFKKAFGKTINEYLRYERMMQARRLLTEGQTSIKEVALRVGYGNSSYFARRFKEKYGLFPNEYLRSLHSNVK